MKVETAKKAAATLLAIGASLASAADEVNPSPKGSSIALPADESVNQAIDQAFREWSSAWMMDRYIPNSALTKERGINSDTYVIRGTFDFVRMGSRNTIPFAAAFSRTADKYSFSNLCYQDHTSGMVDCIDPSAEMAARKAQAMQTRQALGAVVLLGLVAAMGASSDSSSSSPKSCRTYYSYGTPGNLGYSCSGGLAPECGIPYERCD